MMGPHQGDLDYLYGKPLGSLSPNGPLEFPTESDQLESVPPDAAGARAPGPGSPRR